VEVVNDGFASLKKFDCMVSAANSFGLMDGGVDLAILDFFGIELMDRIQERIVVDYLGEQPVGTSFIIETGNKKHPFVAHTPTMRVPMPIRTTDYVYSAMWAMLVAVNQHNRTHPMKIASVACPGLGTATGRVPSEEAARQMALAYRWSLKPETLMSWPYALARQSALGRGGDNGIPSGGTA
jgi:O-acetyl-ADP-ribose deacetylase (regulator of RNase III)